MISSHFALRTPALIFFAAFVSAQAATLPQMTVPDKWADAPVVLCEDSVLCDLKVNKDENKLDITEISWYKVQRSNTGDLRELKFLDNEFIEKKPWLQVLTFDDNGTREKVGSDCFLRERTSEDPRAQFNLYVHKTGIFVTKVSISSYDRVRFIRTEQRRSKVKAVFFGHVFIRGPFPIVHKTVRIKVPQGMENAVGVSKGGAANMDTITRREGSSSVISISCTDLSPLPNKNIHYPERWVPIVNLKFPPKAAALYSWKQIGDYYLGMIAGQRRTSADLDSEANAIKTRKAPAIEAAFGFVQQHTHYYGSWEGMHGFVPRPPSEVLRNGYGDCKELSLLLCTLLRGIGCECFPALVSARREFMQVNPEFPSLGVFNHMIVAVPKEGRMWYLDPTCSPATAATSYYNVIGRKTLVLVPGASIIDSVSFAKEYRNDVATLSAITRGQNGGWFLEGTIRQYGHAAFDFEQQRVHRLSLPEEAIVSSYVRTMFGLPAISVRMAYHGLDSVQFSFACPFDEFAVRMPHTGFVLQLPGLHRGYAPEAEDVAEGPWENCRYRQQDRWVVFPGMAKTSFFSCVNQCASGRWRCLGDTVERYYDAQRAVFGSAAAPDCQTLVGERNRFAKGTIWKE
jgi:hypothetical protein